MKVILGHGAAGSAVTMRPWVDALSARQIQAEAVDLPKSNQVRAIDVFRRAVTEEPAIAIGGHSYGGRMASMLAAERPVIGLVLLSYPLHRPGDTLNLRVQHWPAITCPVLLLSGENDPFANLDLLRDSVHLIPNATLITYPRVRHGLTTVLDEAADQVAEFLTNLPRPAAKRD